MPAQLAPVPEDNPRRRRGRRGGRRKSRRRNPSRTNPTAVTYVMIAAASAVAIGAGVGYGFYRRRKKKVLPPPPEGPKKPGGGGGGGGGGPKACNYVDCHIALADIGQQASPFVWPHKDRWSTNRQLGVQLEVLGYDVGNVNAADWNMVRKTAMDATQAFQHDYNIVRAAAASLDLPTAPTAGKLAVDGLFGSSTANALYDASIWAAIRPWKQIVDEASALS